MVGFLYLAFVCSGLWLLFPKGFKYLVGTWVGAMGGTFFWGLFDLAWFVGLGLDMSWAALAWTFIGFIIAGMVAGCFLAAKG